MAIQIIQAIFVEDGDGICVAHNRPPQTGEYAINTSPGEWSKGWRHEFYIDNAGNFEPRPQGEIDQILSDEASATTDKDARMVELETERESAGLREISVTTARNQIDNRIDNAATNADKIAEIKDILKKMVPYILEER